MDKRWPLSLIKRGTKPGGSKTIWWQETDEGTPTAQAARDVGYEAYEMVPVSYPETIAGAAENLLACLPGEFHIEYADTADAIEQLKLRIESFRDNVDTGKPE